MINEHHPFVNGRDTESQLSFVLSLKNVGTYTGTFSVGGEVVSIPVNSDDAYAVFLPSAGFNFLISPVTPFPTIPAVVDATPMSEVNAVQNPAVVNLKEWLEASATEFYLTSPDPQTMTVLIYGGKV